MGLALVALPAAAVVALAGGLDQHEGRDLIARLLAAGSTILFASGYAIVMCVGRRRGKRELGGGLRRFSAGAWVLAALLGSYQLVVVNDSVDSGLKVALVVSICGGALAGALVPVVEA